jgi:DNA-binding transcriptional LysR family regulator
MIPLDDIRFFQVLVKAGSMAAAARELNVSPPAVTQRLQQMEARYRVRLVDRSARSMRLTGEGELLYEKGAAICHAADELLDQLMARSGVVAGNLRIDAPLGFGRRHLAPLIGEFHALHPHLTVSLSLYDRLSARDIHAIDVVFYIGELHDSSMVRYTIAPNDRWLCAAPAYLRARGTPAVPEALVHHDSLMLRENNENVSVWKFARGADTRNVRVDPVLVSNDGEVIRQWALQGKGIAMRSEWDVADAVGAGKLVRLLPDWTMPAADIVALVPQRKGISARGRAFIEFVQAKFAPTPPWRR